MNKQEAIEKIKNIGTLNIYDKVAGQQVDMVIKNQVIDIISQIDEPQKPVVPKFVLEWVDNSREHSFDFDEWFDYENQPLKVCHWLNSEKKRQAELNVLALITLIVNGANAVEVEQEKLYTVEIPNPNGSGYSKNYLARNKDGKVEFFTWSGYTSIEFADDWKQEDNAQLTESEIKQDFDFLWQFAKEVE